MSFAPRDFPQRQVLGDEESGAVLSLSPTPVKAVYRYVLWRTWAPELPRLVWCMLNPSTADHKDDDPTIRKVCGFSSRLGFGGAVVVNLFGFRATYPKELLESKDPRGPLNMDSILRVLSLTGAEHLMCAWGASSSGDIGRLIRSRAENLVSELRHRTPSPALRCLKTTKDGYPWHPCMLGYVNESQPWIPPSKKVSNILI